MSDKDEAGFDRDYERGILRSELVSLFWAVISERKREPNGYALQELADRLGINKSQVSRWFNGLPNWEANTIADIAAALGVDLQVMARDRRDGRVYTASGSFQTQLITSSINFDYWKHNGAKLEATGVQSRGQFKLSQMAA